jgi:hypothetical protein
MAITTIGDLYHIFWRIKWTIKKLDVGRKVPGSLGLHELFPVASQNQHLNATIRWSSFLPSDAMAGHEA